MENGKKEVRKNNIHWVSISAFLSAIAGWTLFNFFRYDVYSLIVLGIFLLASSPFLGIFGYIRNSREEDTQFRKFNNYLSTVGILTSLVFWVIAFIRILV